MADNSSALRTSRGEPSLFEQVRTAAQITPEAQYEMTSGASDTQFEKGLRTGAVGLTAGSFANQALSQEVGGDADWQRSRDLALQTQAQGQMYAPRVSSLRNIGSLEDAGDYAAGAIGQGAMSMAPTLATALLTRGRGKFGTATSFAGGATTAYGLERGEAALNQYADPTLAATSAEDRDLAATTKGVINAGLEAVVPAGLAGSVLRKPAGSFLGHVGRGSLTEGLTEAAQQGVGFGAERYLDPNRQLDPWDVADAFAAGALTGGGVSAATRGPAHGAQALADRFARSPEAAPVQEQGPAAEPPMDAAPPGTPLPPAPDDGSGGGVGDLFDTLNEYFGPELRGQAQKAKDYVSDIIDRMDEVAKTAQSPSDFLRQVFGNSSEEAAADLRPDIEDPSVLNATDPAAALRQRDAERQQRAARFAEELLSDPATPDAIKERVASFGGDFTNPEAQAFVARNLVSQRAGEKLAAAVADLIDMSKEFGSKAAEVGTDLAAKASDVLDEGMTAAADRIVKKNLQDSTPAEQAAFNKLIFDNLTDEAKANPTVRQRLPEIANAMLAFAARTGDLTKADLKTLSRMQDGMAMFRDPDAVAAQLTEYAGLPRTKDSFLSRIKRVTNAQQDVRQPNSFLYSSLTEEAKDSLRPAQLNQLARLVDDFTLSDASKAQGDKVLAGLTAAFGSKESAQAVLDYYQQQNRADVRFDPNEMLTEGGTTERDGAPAPTYQFADAKAMRPYRAFAGSELSSGKNRREAVQAAINLKGANPAARVQPVKMSQYVTDTGGNPETEIRRIAADVKDRIDQHKARKGEDRSQQINQLQGELTLMRQAYKSGGAQAALDLYEVLQVSGQEQNDTIASDEDIAKMATLADAKDAKETRVTFQREDGSKFTLSAESMWKTLGDKEGSGKGENAQARAKRLFADAAASVLARPEVSKMVTPMEKILIDRKLGVQAKKKGNPKYREMVSEALRAAEGSIKQLESTLDAVVDEYLDAADNEAKSEEYGSRREEIEGIIERNIAQLSERLDAAREGNGPLAGNMPAQAVARQKLRMYRDARSQIDAAKFDEEFDERDNNRSGVPGADESGPMGPNGLPRTRMNEELGNTGTRYYEEDTGLGVGVEKRGQRAQPSAQKKAAEVEPGQPGSREAPHSIPMYYKIGNVLRLRKELRGSYSSSDSISALIERGDRTGTTRQPPQGVLPGHYVTFPGVKGLYRVTGFEKIDLRSDAGREAWSKREGWSPEAADTFGSQVQHGKVQMQFERVDGSSRGVPSNSRRVVLPATGAYTAKDQAKSDKANKFIGRGTPGSSTAAYAEAWGDRANVGEYSPEDTVFISVNGNRPGALSPPWPEIKKAMAGGATLITDVPADRNRSFNTGERAVAEFLGKNGYRESSPGTWVRGHNADNAAGQKRSAEKQSSAPQQTPKTSQGKVVEESAMDGRPGRPGKNWGDKDAVKAEILRLRGKDVKVAVEKLVKQLGSSGRYTYDPATGERLIEVAINARSPVGTARHEAMHDLFRFLSGNDALRSVARDLRDATSAPHVIRQLRDLLKDHKAALEQLNDPEERAAYAYQFWAEGLLQIGPKGTGFFHTIHQFIKDLFGVVIAGQRGEDLLRAFHDGKFADPSTVQEVLQDINDSRGDRVSNKLNKAAPALTHALNALFSAAPDRLRRFENDYLNVLADKFQPESGTGFVQNKFRQEGVWKNRLGGILRDTTAVERREAIDQLQAMKPTSKLAKELAKFNEDIYEYMRDAGVQSWDSATKKFVPLRKVQEYFTRSWDPDAIARNRSEFETLLRTEGNMSATDAAALVENLVRGSEQRPKPNESPVDLGFMPYAPHTSERVLTFINPGNADKFAKFQRKDLADIMTSYVRGSTHRAEYTREFGNNGEKIVDLIVKSGIKDANELREISNAVQALEGSLDPGNWSVQTKEAMSALMTLQNVTLLPLALVSQMIDPIVLAARTGDLRDAGNAYMTALKRLKNTITKSKDKVPNEELAEILGVVSEDSTLQAMSMAYGATRMSKRMENINRVFFKYNGMQGWNNSMRIAATAAGEKYLLAHRHDAKALAELGLEPKDVKVGKNGRLNVSSPKVQQAMFQFVDQAVLRPSAANRPVWVSDPRFLLVAHLKQFTFAIHNVILKRANRELQNDNPKPWGILMLAMPVILAADMAKFALTGTAPSTWSFKDYLVHAVERSGLLGLGDFSVQAMGQADSGKMPGEGLLGPTFENLMEILRWIGGDPRTDFEDVLDRTVPGSRFV